MHGVTPDRSRAILERAESLRTEACRLLLDDASPDAWLQRCEVHVHVSAASFAKAMGGPPAAARGATSLEFASSGITMRRIDVVGDSPDAIPDGLAHEIAHVVLAERFLEAPPPRWVDEGIALLFDPPARQRLHDDDFREALRNGLAWTAADLIAIEDYPSGTARQRVFYGQSAALVRWLVARRGIRIFVAFASDCGTIGTAAALAEHYGIDAVVELDAAWTDLVGMESDVVTAAGW